MILFLLLKFRRPSYDFIGASYIISSELLPSVHRDLNCCCLCFMFKFRSWYLFIGTRFTTSRDLLVHRELNFCFSWSYCWSSRNHILSLVLDSLLTEIWLCPQGALLFLFPFSILKFRGPYPFVSRSRNTFSLPDTWTNVAGCFSITLLWVPPLRGLVVISHLGLSSHT